MWQCVQVGEPFRAMTLRHILLLYTASLCAYVCMSVCAHVSCVLADLAAKDTGEGSPRQVLHRGGHKEAVL